MNKKLENIPSDKLPLKILSMQTQRIKKQLTESIHFLLFIKVFVSHKTCLKHWQSDPICQVVSQKKNYREGSLKWIYIH